VKARLIEARELGPGTRHFEFEALDVASDSGGPITGWDGAFTPGQFLSLTAQVGGDEITRAYSIASPPEGRRFGLCANLVDGGHFSPWLFARVPGDEIEFKGPYGVFTPRPSASDSILVATGTGVAPFRSFLLGAGMRGNCRLILGTRHEAGLLYDDEWHALERSRTGFIYQPTLTRPDPDWKGSIGRVQTHVLQALGERRDVDVYICGLREMVDEMRGQLKAEGVDRKRIIFEKYD
jgi:ferredoxin-NADP reductase